jgi:hypothetical protein
MAKKQQHQRTKKKLKRQHSQLQVQSKQDQQQEILRPIENQILGSQFDADTIALADGNMELLQNIRDMISCMDDYELWKCMEDIKNGVLSPDVLIDLINKSQLEQFKNKNVKNIDNRLQELKDQKIEKVNDEILNEVINGDEKENFEDDVDEGDVNSFEGREFSFDLELSNNFFDPYKFHDALFKLLQIIIPSSNTDDSENQRIYDLFITMATFCDPYTQPSSTGNNNEMILSADLVSDLIIALNFNEYFEYHSDSETSSPINLPNFDMAYDIAKIINKILIILNSDDENNLTYIKNDELNWENELSKWLPHNVFSNIINIASDFHHMNLLYTIVTVGLLMIHKLYKNLGNICLNPFLSLYLQIWKNQTRIIYMCIEIDRRDENNGFPGYPEVIRYMVKGSSAIRSMISLILNDDFEKREHDVKHESLLNFMRPWGRKFTNGSINRDIRIFVAALLALGSELDSVTELLFNFDPEDKYDEDIKYMFEMELEDMNGGEPDLSDEKQNDKYYIHHKENIKKFIGENGIFEIERDNESDNDSEFEEISENSGMNEKQPMSALFDLHPDCNCVFEDFESESEYEDVQDLEFENDEEIQNLKKDNEITINEFENLNQLNLENLNLNTIKNLHLEMVRNINNGPVAIRSTRSNSQFNIDSKGRDWRDIPRGENTFLSKEFIELLKLSTNDATIFITPIKNLLQSLKEMTITTLDSKKCEKIIRSVAWVVQYEHESSLMKAEEEIGQNNDESITADVIYDFLKTDDSFVRMIEFNPSSSFFIIDELLMAEGYRRVLIWFLTHLPLNQWIINYFHDLLVGLRGNPTNKENLLRFSFSRMGALELSEIEKSMLLHEFLSNAVIFLSRGSSYEFEDIVWNQIEEYKSQEGAEKEEAEENGTKTEEFKLSSFISNRSNAQKLIKIICLMLKSLERYGILKPGDAEYRVEIQTLLVQWVGVGFVPEARELFFRYSSNFEKEEEKDKEKKVEMIRNNENKNNMLNKLKLNQIYKLISFLKNFNSTDIFLILLNIANHYGQEKTICFKFMKDLNSISHTYENDDALYAACNELFDPLHEAIENGDEERVVEISYAAHLIGFDENENQILHESIQKIREIITMFFDCRIESDDEKFDMFKEHFASIMGGPTTLENEIGKTTYEENIKNNDISNNLKLTAEKLNADSTFSTKSSLETKSKNKSRAKLKSKDKGKK